MSWFWNRSKDSQLEDMLRSERPAPRPEFLHAVANRVDARSTGTSLRLRVVLASALTLGMFVAVASVGGVSYAASGAQKAVQSVGHVLSPAPKATQATPPHNGNGHGDHHPDHDQYHKHCKDEVKQSTKAEQEQHKANLQAAHTKQEKRAENERHAAALKSLNAAKKECDKGNDV